MKIEGFYILKPQNEELTTSQNNSSLQIDTYMYIYVSICKMHTMFYD